MFSSNGLRAVLFDLDGTLKHYLPEGGEVVANYAVSLGLPIAQEDRRRAIRWEMYYWASSPEWQADQAIKEEEDAFWVNFSRRYLAALGAGPAQANELAPLVHQFMKENHHPESRLPDGAYSVLQMLKNAGFVMGVVSNRQKPYAAELDGLGLGSYLGFSLAAGEVQAWKPDPRIFLHALERAGTTAAQTVYVGDNYFADVVGAQRAGLQPVLYDWRRLFPEAECPVITSFDELPSALEGM